MCLFGISVSFPVKCFNVVWPFATRVVWVLLLLDFETWLCILDIISFPDTGANTVSARYLRDWYLGICLLTKIVALKSILAVLFRSFAHMHIVAKILSHPTHIFNRD